MTLRDLERANSRSLRLRSLISLKGSELEHMLMLSINRKPYMESSMAESQLIVNDLERSKSRFAYVLIGWTSVQYTYRYQ